MKKKEENIIYEYNNYQDLRLGNIEASIKKINEEMGNIEDDIGEIKITMATNFERISGQVEKVKTELSGKINEIKASKKEVVYAILVPILMAIIGVLVTLIIL